MGKPTAPKDWTSVMVPSRANGSRSIGPPATVAISEPARLRRHGNLRSFVVSTFWAPMQFPIPIRSMVGLATVQTAGHPAARDVGGLSQQHARTAIFRQCQRRRTLPVRRIFTHHPRRPDRRRIGRFPRAAGHQENVALRRHAKAITTPLQSFCMSMSGSTTTTHFGRSGGHGRQNDLAALRRRTAAQSR